MFFFRELKLSVCTLWIIRFKKNTKLTLQGTAFGPTKKNFPADMNLTF